ncbi:MAG: 2-hydroxyacyl-CoA dehydratase family protein [bacterium]|nr:2-hydroxyacyl-CoA dehydratase family protein [bacterium]
MSLNVEHKNAEVQDLAEFSALEQSYLRQMEGVEPLIGYLCLRVPPEYIEASGAIPMRLIPRSGFDVQGSHSIRTDGCSFCRTLPALLQLDYYRGLSAILFGSCCDQMRRVSETLATVQDIPVHLYGAPRSWNQPKDYFQQEMTNAFTKIQIVTGKTPTNGELNEKIRQRNRLKATVIGLRQNGRLPTSMLHQIAASPLPPEPIIDYLARYVRRAPTDIKIRLLLTGSIPGVWELSEFESAGACIVADATCLGDRVFSRVIEENGDAVTALYQGYVGANDCPHRRPNTPLIEYMQKLISERKVGGVIFRSVKYCHPWGLAAERMKKDLQLPILILNDDLTSPAVSNLRTRVGAFIEMLKSNQARR